MSLFGHKVLDNKDIYARSLDDYKYNDYNCTIGYNFNGGNIQEKYGNTTYMSIIMMPEFAYASYEELRLADYEKTETGNIEKYKIIDTSYKNTQRKTFLENDNFGEISISPNINNTFGSINDNNPGTISLFGNNNQNNGGLFGNSIKISEGESFSNNNQTGWLFRNNIQSSGGGLFGNNNQKIKGLFGEAPDNNNLIKNKNIFGLLQNNNEVIDQENNPIKIPRNNRKNLFLKDRKKCIHENDFTSYNIEKEDNESGLLCYNCLYKYYKYNIQNCIPIKDNNFENYKKFYKDCINKYKVIIQNIFKEIISEIEKYEKEEIDNISTLFDEKVDLKFKLPVEISFIERFEIAINRKIISLLDNKLFNCKINHNYVNLFQNELKELKFKKNNPNEKEIIKIRSSIDFNIFGIALPKIPENEGNNIEMVLTSDNIILNKITKFENYENLSIGLFDTNIIKINKNTDYFIEIKGIKNLDFISNDEEYNENTKLEINSNNQETILAALIIE